jgi:hypothetical protein
VNLGRRREVDMEAPDRATWQSKLIIQAMVDGLEAGKS